MRYPYTKDHTVLSVSDAAAVAAAADDTRAFRTDRAWSRPPNIVLRRGILRSTTRWGTSRRSRWARSGLKRCSKEHMLRKPVVAEILSLFIAKSFRFRLQYGHELCPTIQASKHCGAGESRQGVSTPRRMLHTAGVSRMSV